MDLLAWDFEKCRIESLFFCFKTINKNDESINLRRRLSFYTQKFRNRKFELLFNEFLCK